MQFGGALYLSGLRTGDSILNVIDSDLNSTQSIHALYKKIKKSIAESVVVWDMADLSKPKKTINVAKDSGLPATKAIRRAVHPEYSADGTEVWISLWGGKTDQSAIVVYDDKTLAVKKVITDPKMITPTGKFNVYNTQHDIY